MKVVAIIPARMGSSRFAGKPLAPLLGKPMLQWVFEGTRACRALQEVYVATCDAEIDQAARRFGAPALLTSPRHVRASDRVAEAASRLDADVVIMVQGDEPMITAAMIDEALAPFADPAVQCTNLTAPIESEQEFLDPNTIKVIAARSGDALYFSRAAIPHAPGTYQGGDAWKQVCVIGFRAGMLQRYAALSPTPAEEREAVDMLRFLEHGIPVRMAVTAARTHAVDTPADLERVEALMRSAAR